MEVRRKWKDLVDYCAIISGKNGKILVNYVINELPFEVPKLCLLIASLYQLSGEPCLSMLVFQGYNVILTSKNGITTLLLCRLATTDSDLQLIRLICAEITFCFSTCHVNEIPTILEQLDEESTQLVENYNLTNALDGLCEERSTMAVFKNFKNQKLLSIFSSNIPSTNRIKLSGVEVNGVNVLDTFLLNVVHKKIILQISGRKCKDKIVITENQSIFKRVLHVGFSVWKVIERIPPKYYSQVWRIFSFPSFNSKMHLFVSLEFATIPFVCSVVFFSQIYSTVNKASVEHYKNEFLQLLDDLDDYSNTKDLRALLSNEQELQLYPSQPKSLNSFLREPFEELKLDFLVRNDKKSTNPSTDYVESPRLAEKPTVVNDSNEVPVTKRAFKSKLRKKYSK